MDVFILDEDPIKSFQYHIDKHTVKSLYIVESNYTKIKVGLFR